MTVRPPFPDPERLPDSDRLILFHGGRLAVRGEAVTWRPAEARAAFGRGARALLVDEGVVALELEEDPSARLSAELRSLRGLLLAGGSRDLALAGKAAQLLDWCATHRHCGACGAPTRRHEARRALRCSGCGRLHFPRVDPCVIALVARGREVLLARGARFRTGLRSCLAGFVEPGETAEEAVRREVREEVGLEVDNIRYVKSQPWPFPSQLMLGFHADYRAGDIVPEEGEIEEAGWFDIDRLPPVPPPEVSVAGELIRDYVRQVRSGPV